MCDHDARQPTIAPDRAVVAPSVGETGYSYVHHRIDKHGKATEDKSLESFKGPHYATTHPWTVTEDDIRFPLLSDGDYIDSLSLLGVTPDGQVILCQLLVTNLGLSPRVGVQFKWTDHAKGVIAFHKDEHAMKSLKISEDGLTWNIGDKHIFRWDPATKVGHVTMNHEKEGIKADLTFAQCGGSYKIGNGLVSFGAKKFQFLAYPAPRAIVSGKISCGKESREMTGTTGFISHAFQNMKSHHIACRWHMVKFHAHEDKATVNINIGVSPKTCEHVPMANGAYVLDKDMVICSTNAWVNMAKFETDKASSYPVPTTAEYHLEGLNQSGESVHVHIPVPSTHVVERLDILSTLPFLLRTLIKAFVAKPYFFVMMNTVEAIVTTGPNKVERRMKGWLVHEIMYLNPEAIDDVHLSTSKRETPPPSAAANPSAATPANPSNNTNPPANPSNTPANSASNTPANPSPNPAAEVAANPSDAPANPASNPAAEVAANPAVSDNKDVSATNDESATTVPEASPQLL